MVSLGARAKVIDKQKLPGMLFSSLNLYREASFFSRKTSQIIKNAINPPKKTANSYSIYYMEHYPQFKGTDIKITEISKNLGAKWNNLSPEEKSIFESKAEVLRKKYESEKEAFNQSLSERQKVALGLLILNRRAKNGDIGRRNLTPNQKEFLKSMPEPSAITPRGVFMSQKLKGVSASAVKPTDGLASAMKEWTNLSPKDQEAYAQQAKKNLDSYVNQLSSFLKK